MDEAIGLAIESHSPFPDRTAFIDAGTPSAGRRPCTPLARGFLSSWWPPMGRRASWLLIRISFPRTFPWLRPAAEFGFLEGYRRAAGQSRKLLASQGARGFESHPLRYSLRMSAKVKKPRETGAARRSQT